MRDRLFVLFGRSVRLEAEGPVAVLAVVAILVAAMLLR
ncbi:hypothetical protein OHA_1_03017 [Pleomorphomonas sp. SM30]|uniref:Uncharacterized protein n=1 Tax=Oharaeibacter diazotrophicus TaxID=1920512 RepID=A0A4R6RDU2_9HYPH|nr:hypothetical protein EDD54_2976 [Oharaeibacter diazotrophicus]BBE73406.1 hypothetical protein OHA_1_03017 [Pleomorphomonas sp. SM30]